MEINENQKLMVTDSDQEEGLERDHEKGQEEFPQWMRDMYKAQMMLENEDDEEHDPPGKREGLKTFLALLFTWGSVVALLAWIYYRK